MAERMHVHLTMRCGICDFAVPVDRVGVALMREHLSSEHGIRTVPPPE